MTVSSVKFGCGWIFTYKDRVQRRRVIAADSDKYDWQLVLCRYGR